MEETTTRKTKINIASLSGIIGLFVGVWTGTGEIGSIFARFSTVENKVTSNEKTITELQKEAKQIEIDSDLLKERISSIEATTKEVNSKVDKLIDLAIRK